MSTLTFTRITAWNPAHKKPPHGQGFDKMFCTGKVSDITRPAPPTCNL